MVCVYSAVQTEFLNVNRVRFSLEIFHAIRPRLLNKWLLYFVYKIVFKAYFVIKNTSFSTVYFNRVILQ
jgi:hypothetical protein